MTEPLLWSLSEAAEALRISTRTLKRMAADGTLPPGAVVHLGRRRLFSRRILEDWSARGCTRPGNGRGRR
jgi:excisionase family DNA binding protein